MQLTTNENSVQPACLTAEAAGMASSASRLGSQTKRSSLLVFLAARRAEAAPDDETQEEETAASNKKSELM